MRIGVTLPRYTNGVAMPSARALTTAPRAIQDHGLSSVWVPDLLGRGQFNPDPLTTLAVATAVTDRLLVGTAILQLPVREPFELATRIATLQVLAGARLRLGVGVGSSREDFAATGNDFEERFRALDQRLEAIRTLLSGGEVNGCRLYPRDVEPDMPAIFIGSWGSPGWLRRAAEEFSGWICSAKSGDLDKAVGALDGYRAAGGRYAVITNVRVPAAPEGTPEDTEEIAGRVRAAVRPLADAGFDEVVLRTEEYSDAVLAATGAVAREFATATEATP